MNGESQSCNIFSLPCATGVLGAVYALIVVTIFYFTFKAYKYAQPGAKKKYFYNPFWLFFPGNFTVEGNKYRQRAAILIGVLLILVIFGEHILRAFE